MTKKNKNGFTLIELVLFMGLFSILLVILTTVFTALVQKQLEIQSISSVESDRDYILSRLKYDISRASAIQIPETPGETTQQLVLVIDGQTTIYELQNSALELTINNDTQRMNNVNTNISNLIFTRVGNASGTAQVKVTLTIESNILEAYGQRSASINTFLGLR